MNHSVPFDAAELPSAPERTTRSTPSAPSPPCRSHSARTREDVRSSEASGSGSTTKSLPVPWPLANATACTPPSLRCTLRRQRVEHRRHQIGAPAVEPSDPLVAPEPRALPADKPPGGGDRVAGRLAHRALAIKGGDHLTVAQGPRGGAALAKADRQQPPHLVDEPGVEHLFHAPLDQPVELGGLPVDADEHRIVQRAPRHGQKRRERLAGERDD